MQDDRIPLYLNPAAGRGRGKRLGSAIAEIFRSRGIAIDVVESTAHGDIENRITQDVNSGCKNVVVAGGDGTVHEAVNGILRANTKASLGVIPIGTGNDFAKAISAPLDWHRASLDVCGRLQSSTSLRHIDVGKMNGRYFANGAGIGFDAKINSIAKKIRVPIGGLVYLYAVFRGLLVGVITPTVRLQHGGDEYKGPITLANISNGPWVGGLFHVAPMAKPNDGHLDLIVVGPMSRGRIVWLLPKLMRGTHVRQADIRHHEIEAFSLSSIHPLPSHLDGEVQPLQTEFEIRILKQMLTLL